MWLAHELLLASLESPGRLAMSLVSSTIGGMAMINVHVCDTSSREGKVALNNLNRIKAQHVITFSAPMSNGVGVMIGKVMEEATKSPTGTIKKLAIWAHGGPGSQGVSRGADATGNAHWAGIDLETLAGNEDMRSTLGQLWTVTDWNGWVELRGCRVGEGVRGQQFLNILTILWGVPVHAGEVDQSVVVGGSGLELAWTGTVHVAKPGVSGTTTFQGQIKR
jgi:hypothetical protein